MISGSVNRRSHERQTVGSLCVLQTPEGPMSGRLRDISAAGAFLETNHRPPLGEGVMLNHPVAGVCVATVARHALDGIGLAFTLGEASIRFALTVVSADMTVRETPHGLALAEGAR